MTQIVTFFKLLRLPLIALGIALLSLGCGAGTSFPQNATGCDAGSALIGVGDGYLVILCGCNEAAGTLATTSGALTCTVNSGSLVVFQYLGPGQLRQILSTTTGGQTFPHGPVFDPNASPSIRSHAFRPTAVGTYTFSDAYSTELSGQIVAQ